MSDLRHPHETFYDELWRRESPVPSRHERDRFALILGLAAGLPLPNREVLDAGCGTGKLSGELRVLGQVTAIDWSGAGISSGQQRLADVRFERRDLVRGDMSDLEGRFGLAVCSEVLEHVGRENRERFLSNLTTTLAPSGFLLLTTPNARVARSISELGALYQPDDDLLEPEDTLALIRSAGLEVVRTVSATFFESAWERSALFRRIRRALPGRDQGADALDRLLRGTLMGLYLGCLAKRT